jgi:hypothetical protein
LERYFCTAAHVVRPIGEGRAPVPLKGLLVHAKTMGTTKTACGIDATSWTKLWEFPFTGRGTNLCQDCREAVANSNPSERAR